MNRLRILPYTMKSLSSRTISRHFDTKRIYPNGKFKPRNGDVVLNWGFCGDAAVLKDSDADFKIINKPEAVALAGSKTDALSILKDNNIPHVEFHTSKENAEAALNDGKTIYCRTLTRSKEGKGIVIAKTTEELVNAPLYTEYFENDTEFRVHVFMEDIIDIVQKRKMSSERRAEFGIEEVDPMIKNLKKGYSFCRKDIEIPDDVKQIAIDTVKAIGLDFGAVDIAYNTENSEAKVLEVNTAVGQKRGTTTNLRYTRAITEKVLGEEFSVEEYNRRYNCDAETYLR